MRKRDSQLNMRQAMTIDDFTALRELARDHDGGRPLFNPTHIAENKFGLKLRDI